MAGDRVSQRAWQGTGMESAVRTVLGYRILELKTVLTSDGSLIVSEWCSLPLRGGNPLRLRAGPISEASKEIHGVHLSKGPER